MVQGCHSHAYTLTRWAFTLVHVTIDIVAYPSILTRCLICTYIVNSKIFTLCCWVILKEAGTVREWTAVLEDHFTYTVAMAVLNTFLKTSSIAGYVAIGTVGTRMTDTLITTRCKVVAGAISRAGVGRTGIYDVNVSSE